MLHLVVRQMEHAPAMRRENDDVTATAACDPNPAHPVELIGDYTQVLLLAWLTAAVISTPILR